MEKSALRKIFREKRLALSGAEMAEKSQQITQNFIENILPKNRDKIFAIYLSSDNEVNTTWLLEHFQKNKIKFCYPKIIAKNQPLEFILAQANQRFAPKNFFPKILEPVGGEKILPDFLILPLVAFDQNLSRLGMGGGFFDRTIELLKTQKPQLTTIGLAYEFQRAGEIIPIEKTDQKLDIIVTEKIIFSAS